MTKSGIDQDALIDMFSQASAKQGEALRKAVADATLKALQGRELTLENIRKVIKSVTQATSAGVARNSGANVDVEGLLSNAVAGMDAALLRAVEANRTALAQFIERGAGLQETPLKQALANVEKMEDAFFAAVAKATQSSGSLEAPWSQVLDATRAKGTDTGARASAVAEQLMSQAQAAMRESRASGMRAAQAMMDSYAALASGVLSGMSEGLQQGSGKSQGAAEVPKPKRR
jgi:hypothetical protein